MYKQILFISLLSGTVLFANVAHGRGGSTPAPWIDSTLIDTKQSVLTIHGRSFGPTTPGVFLGKLPLKVRKSSDLEIVAELPDSLKTASYRLVVVTGSTARISSEPFFTTILATRPGIERDIASVSLVP